MQTPPQRDIYSITRLNREVRAVVEDSFPPVWVQGEISNLARPASGHIYFTLKDQSSQVRCAMFKNRRRSLTFSPDNGHEVVARVTLSLYEGRGEFQLIVDAMEAAGAGALQLAFEQLKQRLHNAGLFADEQKKALPPYPQTIGVITSPTGAAIRDILTVLKRRYAQAGIIVYPVLVQGEGAAAQISAAIRTANQRQECDVLIIARGGGSLEDLWCFNEEQVAREMYASMLPIVSGVGHEIDFTIADFVADQRAATPSAAAELITPDSRELLSRLDNLAHKLLYRMQHINTAYRQLIQQLQKRLPHPAQRLQTMAQRSDDLSIRLNQAVHTRLIKQRAVLNQHTGELKQYNPLPGLRSYQQHCRSLARLLHAAMENFMKTQREHLQHSSHNLNTVSPLATLERGYAIVTDNADKILLSAASIKPGDAIKTRLGRGKIESVVHKTMDEEH